MRNDDIGRTRPPLPETHARKPVGDNDEPNRSIRAVFDFVRM